jgi:tetratricopeptide (TPR) repeat protein
MRNVFKFYRRSAGWRCCGVCIVLFGLFHVPRLHAAFTDAEIQELAEYADGLTRLGMPDYSAKVLSKVGNDPRFHVPRIKLLGQTGKWDEIDTIIGSLPDQNGDVVWTMKLAKADGLYAHGKYENAKTIYAAFFKRYAGAPPANVRAFYLDSAYKFAQMLLLLGDLDGAADAYKAALKAKPEKGVQRQMSSDLAEILLRLAEESKGEKMNAYLKQADKIADDLLWVRDLWFGKAIVFKAHGMMLKDDVEGAMQIFEDYKSDLIDIDKNLKEIALQEGLNFDKFSPVAQCRFLLGKVLHEQAKKQIEAGETGRASSMLLGGKNAKGKTVLGAMQHLVNVFIRYPATSWAADAGRRVEEIRLTVERDLGQTVKFRVTSDQWAKVQQAQLGNARVLVNQHQYDEAADVYLNILTLFPEDQNTPIALSGLAECYMESNNDMYARMALGHLANRYGMNKQLSGPAGDSILRMATLYGDRKKNDVKQYLYNTFFDNFPEHPRTALLLSSFGDEQAFAERYDDAISYYDRVLALQQGTPLFFKSLQQKAFCYSKLGENAKQIQTLALFNQEVAKEDRPGHRLIKGLYRMASAYRALDKKYYGAAIKRYTEIETRLKGDGMATYSLNEEEKAANMSMLEGAKFYKAYCYSKYVPKDGGSNAKYKADALKAYIELAKSHPESSFTPPALMQAGTLYTIFEKPDQAQAVFDQLKKKYPESKEAEDVDFRLGMSLLEIGRRERAIKVFKEMFSGEGNYRPSEILRAANELVIAEEYEISLEGFEKVLAKATPDQRSLVEPALLGKGRCLLAMDRHLEGVAALEEIFVKYPKTGRTVEIAMLLSGGYAEVANKEADADKRFELFNKGVDAMNLVRKYLNSPEGRAMSDVGVGRILELKSAAADSYGKPDEAKTYMGEAIGIYLLLVETGDASDPKVRPHLDDGFERCVDLLITGGHWEDAHDIANRYLELYPSGKHKLNIRKWRTIAKSKSASSGTSTPDSAPEEDAPEEDAPEEDAPEENEDGGDPNSDASAEDDDVGAGDAG